MMPKEDLLELVNEFEGLARRHHYVFHDTRHSDDIGFEHCLHATCRRRYVLVMSLKEQLAE